MSPGDTTAMFELLEDLKNLWIKEEVRVRKIKYVIEERWHIYSYIQFLVKVLQLIKVLTTTI